MTRPFKIGLLFAIGLVSFSLPAQVVSPRSGPDLTGPLVGESTGWGPPSSAPIAASPSVRVPELSTTTFLSSVRGGWARYRFDPNDPADPGLVVESTRRILQLGAKALFLYLSEVKGSGEVDLRSVAQSQRFQTAFSMAKARGVQLIVLNVFAVRTDNDGLPYFGPPPGNEISLLATEFAQIRDLTVYLRSLSLLDGMTVVLKNWESDNIYCTHTSLEVSPCAVPETSASVSVLLQRAPPMARWLRNRQDAVTEGRRQDLYPSPYAVTVMNAVDVNRVHEAKGGPTPDLMSHPRVAHLLPYIGADALTYSSWDSVFHPGLTVDPPDFVQLGIGVRARLQEAFTFLLNDTAQRAGATALCNRGVNPFCLANVGFEPSEPPPPGELLFRFRTADPLALGDKRLVISEWGVAENYYGTTTSARTKAVLDTARTFGTNGNGIRAAFFWALYDNEQVWFESCTLFVTGHERECSAGTRWACSETPGPNQVGCLDKNLWDLGGSFSTFTLGGDTEPPGGPGPGLYLYRPDGRDSLAMSALNAYSIRTTNPPPLWAPLPPGSPLAVRVNRAPFYFGQFGGNAFEWDRPNDETRYLTYEIEVTGPSGFTTTTGYHWWHLDPALLEGNYTWRIRATAADGFLASAWVAGPAFRIVSPQRFFSLAPCRVLDTRNPVGPLGGPSLPTNSERVFVVVAHCGIPSDAVAIASNHTVLPGGSAGSISVFPGNGSTTQTESVAFPAQRIRALAAIDTLATDGAGSVKVRNNSASSINYILDVTGYFR